MSNGESATCVWRVRWWIRVGLVAFWVLLAWQLYLDYGFVAAGEMDPVEIRNGWIFQVGFALVIWSVTFRPYIAVGPHEVVVQGVTRRRVFAKDALVEVEPTAYGLRFLDSEGRSFTSLVCQNTWARNEPRWCDVAEAALGERSRPWRGRDTPPSQFADVALRARLLDASSGLEEIGLNADASVWRLRRSATGTALELEDWAGMVLVTFGDGDHVTEVIDSESLARLLAVFGRGELTARHWRWRWMSGCFLVDAEGASPDVPRKETRFDRWIVRRATYEVESVPVL
ncbi:hypothetical protein RN607_01815 [Demequina capsici]|uniref:Uncharacterized protein n=1 Tax=Demequina capsici TaxID=3075620 RepID=A0AA96JD76_9MICO|nr:hypothetical protein [Demequina sp. PMTSA13]WNM27766.1 hypothetical protein RN607_01815 [Demequina sp. PMTSA13]